MTTEQALQEGIQDVIQALSEFGANSVTINEDVYLDGTLDASPFVNILNSDTLASMDGVEAPFTPSDVYEIPVILYVAFVDWKDTGNEFRDVRQAIVTGFKTAVSRSCNGLDGVEIRTIRAEGPVTGVTYSEQQGPIIPVYLSQSLIFETYLMEC